MVVTKSKKAQRKIESGLKRKVRAETMGVSVGITAPAVSRVNERSCWASSICTPNNQSFVHHSYTNNCLEEYYSFHFFHYPFTVNMSYRISRPGILHQELPQGKVGSLVRLSPGHDMPLHRIRTT